MIHIALLSKGGYAVVVDGRIHSVHETAAEAIRARVELEKQLQRDTPETVTADKGRH